MDETAKTMKGFAEKGYFCAQIMVAMGLHHQGQSNPELLRAMEGFKGGFAFAGKTCGALTGAIGLLGLYAGRGAADEPPNPLLDRMVLDLVDWFEEYVGKKYGSIDCASVTQGQYNQETCSSCQVIVYLTYQKTAEILAAHGFELSGRPVQVAAAGG
ncbi:MAG: DVU_1555 family C-GCAxxG-C-C protein [Thermodesulfobacteriota bacterium]